MRLFKKIYDAQNLEIATELWLGTPFSGCPLGIVNKVMKKANGQIVLGKGNNIKKRP